MKNQLTKEEIAKYYDFPLEDAAKKLGICASVLKRTCRQFGIKRWPYRKIKSLGKKASMLEQAAKSALAQYKRLSAQLQEIQKQQEQLTDKIEDGDIDCEEVSEKKVNDTPRSKIPSISSLLSDNDSIDCIPSPFEQMNQNTSDKQKSLKKPTNQAVTVFNFTQNNFEQPVHLAMQSTSQDQANNSIQQQTVEHVYRPFISFLDTLNINVVLCDIEGTAIWYSSNLSSISKRFFSPNLIGKKPHCMERMKGSTYQLFSAVYSNQLRSVEIDMVVPTVLFNWIIHCTGTRMVRNDQRGAYVWFLIAEKDFTIQTLPGQPLGIPQSYLKSYSTTCGFTQPPKIE